MENHYNMNDKWNNLYTLLLSNQYDNAQLRFIYRKFSDLAGKISQAPFQRDQILRELRFMIRNLKVKEDETGIQVYLSALKYMLHNTYFTVSSLNDYLKNNAIPYQYIVSKNNNNIYNGEFCKVESKKIGGDKPMEINDFDKVFISHSTADKEYARAIVRLLTDIGLKREMIFCSSLNPYGVPLNKNIYDYIREEFIQKKLYVIFLLSTNYYNSVPLLNEMGAAWIVRSEYTSFILPGFEFNKIQGAVDPTKIGIKLEDDTEELRCKLIELRDCIQRAFNLERIDEREWNIKINDFLYTLGNIKN